MQVLLNHVNGLPILTTQFTESIQEFGFPNVTLNQLSGDVVYASLSDGQLYLTPFGPDWEGPVDANSAKILVPDVMTCAGPVSVIDKVLVPVRLEPGATEGEGEAIASAPATGVLPTLVRQKIHSRATASE